MLESGHHLFQPPQFCGPDGVWRPSWPEVSSHLAGSLHWDPACALSILGLGGATGDRCLLAEVTRQPWLSEPGEDGGWQLCQPPKHDLEFRTPTQVALRLLANLEDEAERATQGRTEVYLLLSGGLDSRIVAGVLARLRQQGRLAVRPTAVTWGMAGSRDVLYARQVAQALDFAWVHIELGPADLLANIDVSALRLGALVSPIHLHRMTWFDQLAPDALVLAGSYGDSVGRAEFSGRHVLAVRPMVPEDGQNLLAAGVRANARQMQQADLRALRLRAGSELPWIAGEWEQQGHYMRGLIATAMSVINQRCTLYQMFTAPEVYGGMWAVHPSLRTDTVYAVVLESLGEKLARLPWARTNRAVREPTHHAVEDAAPSYHRYNDWLHGELYDAVRERIDVRLLAETGLFDPAAIDRLSDRIRTDNSPLVRGSHTSWIWLASVTSLARDLIQRGVHLQAAVSDPVGAVDQAERPPLPDSRLRKILRQSKSLYRMVNGSRTQVVRARALLAYPPHMPTWK